MSRRARAKARSSGPLISFMGQQRMLKLISSAIATRGDIEGMLARLGVSAQVLLQRLSILRGEGVARVITLYDPSQGGEPHRCVSLIRLSQLTPQTVARVEAILVDDPAVTTAIQITGDSDYRVTTYHSDYRAAARWARALRDRPEIQSVDQFPVRSLFGDELAGLRLSGPPSIRLGSKPRRR